MMALNERQDERVARHLDGEPVELTGEELDAAREIVAAEEALAPRLDASPPPQTLHRTARRLGAATSGGSGARRWIGVAAAAAAVAIVALGVWLARPGGAPEDDRPDAPVTRAPVKPYTRVPDELAAEVLTRDIDADLDVLDEQMDRIESELVLTESASEAETQLDLERLEQEIEDYAADPLNDLTG